MTMEPKGEMSLGSLTRTHEVLEKRLEERGFDKASVVLSQFLVLKKEENLFQEWLKNSVKAKQSWDALGASDEQCVAFL